MLFVSHLVTMHSNRESERSQAQIIQSISKLTVGSGKKKLDPKMREKTLSAPEAVTTSDRHIQLRATTQE